MVALRLTAACGRRRETEKAPRSKFFHAPSGKKFRAPQELAVLQRELDFSFSQNLIFSFLIEVWLSLVERCVRDAEAAGSSPVTSTSREPRHAIRVLRFFFFIVSTSRLRLVINTRTKIPRTLGSWGFYSLLFTSTKTRACYFYWNNNTILLHYECNCVIIINKVLIICKDIKKE